MIPVTSKSTIEPDSKRNRMVASCILCGYLFEILLVLVRNSGHHDSLIKDIRSKGVPSYTLEKVDVNIFCHCKSEMWEFCILTPYTIQ